MNIVYFKVCSIVGSVSGGNRITANKNLIKKDEKLFIVNKFDNFFYRESLQ